MNIKRKWHQLKNWTPSHNITTESLKLFLFIYDFVWYLLGTNGLMKSVKDSLKFFSLKLFTCMVHNNNNNNSNNNNIDWSMAAPCNEVLLLKGNFISYQAEFLGFALHFVKLWFWKKKNRNVSAKLTYVSYFELKWASKLLSRNKEFMTQWYITSRSSTPSNPKELNPDHSIS